MIVKVSTQWIERLFRYCTEQLPNEACGAVIGTVIGKEIIVHRLQWITNVSNTPLCHFLMNPSELAKLVYLTTRYPCEEQWIGLFHSHPQTVAIASPEDRKTQWSLPTYWIISL